MFINGKEILYINEEFSEREILIIFHHYVFRKMFWAESDILMQCNDDSETIWCIFNVTGQSDYLSFIYLSVRFYVAYVSLPII